MLAKRPQIPSLRYRLFRWLKVGIILSEVAAALVLGFKAVQQLGYCGVVAVRVEPSNERIKLFLILTSHDCELVKRSQDEHFLFFGKVYIADRDTWLACADRVSHAQVPVDDETCALIDDHTVYPPDLFENTL